MHSFYENFLHYKSGLVKFVHEYDIVLGNKEQKELEDDVIDSKRVVPCSSSSTIERQFQREYTSSMFREVQQEFKKKGDCLIHSVTQEGDLFCVNVDEQNQLSGGLNTALTVSSLTCHTRFGASATCLNQEIFFVATVLLYFHITEYILLCSPLMEQECAAQIHLY
ncbi:protein FAR-RED IMPAIRED RESPONSE 1-like [Arachis hypogaea]|nr:protein FAR-RED IMPAIRED RESPONSE 1-like [Arachis hypogaea]